MPRIEAVPERHVVRRGTRPATFGAETITPTARAPTRTASRRWPGPHGREGRTPPSRGRPRPGCGWGRARPRTRSGATPPFPCLDVGGVEPQVRPGERAVARGHRAAALPACPEPHPEGVLRRHVVVSRVAPRRLDANVERLRAPAHQPPARGSGAPSCSPRVPSSPSSKARTREVYLVGGRLSPSESLAHYQAFKWEVIARLP